MLAVAVVVLAALGVLAGAIANRLCVVVADVVIARPRLEIATGVLWGLTALWCGAVGGWGLASLLLVLVTAGVALIAIDLRVHRLPNAIVLALYPVTVIGFAIDGIVTGSWPVLRALVGAAIWLVLFGVVWLISRGRGMGFGDVKLAPVLGAVLGWIGLGPALVGLFAAWLIGGIAALVLLVSGRARRGSHLAFGPFMLIGAGVGLLVGAPVLAWYLGTA